MTQGSKHVSIPGSVRSDIRRISISTGQIAIPTRNEDQPLATFFWDITGSEGQNHPKEDSQVL
jgi:hypothetical protein